MPSSPKIIPVILAGGNGTRLWPLSTVDRPKQFHKLSGSPYSLFQETIIRASLIPDTLRPIVLTNNQFRFLVAEQLQQISTEVSILLEPCIRGTAPAITMAALQALEFEDDPWLLVLPSDHYIGDDELFADSIFQAIKFSGNQLVTFGVSPVVAETGYGYIKAEISETGHNIYPVNEFTEKPPLKLAEQYLKSGNYFWNSGINLYRAQTLLQEVKKLCPEVYQACSQASRKVTSDLDFIRIPEQNFSQCPNISIDYGVLEKSSCLSMSQLLGGWSDLGSWSANWDISEKDSNQNVCQGNIEIRNCQNSFFRSEDRLIAAMGLSNIVVIDNDETILVADKSCSQQVSEFSKLSHPNEKINYRPWGHWVDLYKEETLRIRRLSISPELKISMQMHRKRTEHWLIISGIAEVTCEGERFSLEKGNSIVIPPGSFHSLENNNKGLLEILEVQAGSYLGDDDIVRQ